MGKIKTRLVKRTAERLLKEGVNFKQDFKENKKVLGKEMPSKKVRNQIAGYLVRLKKEEAKKALKQKVN